MRKMFHVNIRWHEGFVKLPEPPPATMYRSSITLFFVTCLNEVEEEVRMGLDGAQRANVKRCTNRCMGWSSRLIRKDEESPKRTAPARSRRVFFMRLRTRAEEYGRRRRKRAVRGFTGFFMVLRTPASVPLSPDGSPDVPAAPMCRSRWTRRYVCFLWPDTPSCSRIPCP